jgi:NDP-sugar pyrophosphorylase family protein
MNWSRTALRPIEGAILAAGRGERLRSQGPDLPKPLVKLGGETLLARQTRILVEAGASRVVAVVNSETAALIDRERIALPAELRLVVRDTPNSMETLFELGEHLAGGQFLAATVDAVVGAGEMTRFVQRAIALTGRDTASAATDGVLGVVRWRGDERPLFVEVDVSGAILKVGAARGTMVTAGVYFLPGSIFDFRARARATGLNALREFLGGLADWGVRMHAVEFREVIDIDVAQDLEAARVMLAQRPARRRDPAEKA